jgi:hypothetical protein
MAAKNYRHARSKSVTARVCGNARRCMSALLPRTTYSPEKCRPSSAHPIDAGIQFSYLKERNVDCFAFIDPFTTSADILGLIVFLDYKYGNIVDNHGSRSRHIPRVIRQFSTA